jgi:hypothetical protein
VSEYIQKSWHTTEETLRELETISKAIGNANISATLRYCVKQTYNNLPATRQPKKAAEA